MISNKVEYYQFLSNPQKYGVWCMKIDFTYSSIQELCNTFNLTSWKFERRMFYKEYHNSIEKVSSNIPGLIPRIFAYLRSTLLRKRRDELPELFPLKDYDEQYRYSKYPSYRRVYRRGLYIFREMTAIPSNLSLSKKRNFRKAAKLYEKEFANYTIYPVPENFSKIDFFDMKSLEYFQVFEENPSSLTFLSPNKKILLHIANLLKELGVNEKVNYLKIYSPENLLMELYVPIVSIIRSTTFINNSGVLNNISQGLEEIKEDRFDHCIRAIGIGAEESLVEIYETFIRDKAKEAPLGNILNELNNKIQLLLYGRANKKENDFKKYKSSIGKLIENEKHKTTSNNELLDFLISFQKEIICVIEKNNKFIEEISEQTLKNQSLPIFPSYVLRCLSDLIALRNRVSHRVERGTSIANVGYIESSISIRSFIGLVYWWQKEKILINYSLSRKEIIESTIERSKAINEEDITST